MIVRALIVFKDLIENKTRTINEEWETDVERAEFLKNKGYVEIIGEQMKLDEEDIEKDNVEAEIVVSKKSKKRKK